MTTSTRRDTTAVRQATVDDIPNIANVLAAAFFDDPVFRWISPDDERRRVQMGPIFELFAHSMVPADASHVAGEAVGAALWVPPGVPAIPEDQAEAAGAEFERVLGEDAPRAFELTALMEEHHPQEPHQYLQFLGVVPERQGEGLGSAMLRTVLDACDTDSVPAYLEATSPDNRRLYERHGFVVTRELRPEGGPPLYAMWREPGR